MDREYYKWVGVPVVVLWFILFFWAFIQYPGSKWTYSLFTLVSTVMLISGLRKYRSYSYLFLAVFLWLGFWLKLTAHLILQYPYNEPTGQFDGSATALDGVLGVATTGMVGVIIAALLLKRKHTEDHDHDAWKAPIWYWRARKWLWALLLLAIVGVAYANAVLSIQQSGVVPRTILIWPMNAVVYWLLSIGFAMGIATLIYWDRSANRLAAWHPYFVLLEGALSTISLLTRAAYIFHAIPQVLALLRWAKNLLTRSKTRLSIFAVTFVFLLLASLSIVGMLRDRYYSNETIPTVNKLFMDAAAQVTHLAVDRWIGIEGVMAVYSYEPKGWNTFKTALLETRAIDKVDLYQKVANSHYQYLDPKEFPNKGLFATLPGPTAFFCYTGSPLVVGLGMFALTVLAMLGERLVAVVTNNPFLCALYGADAANAVAQFGIVPVQLVIRYIMVFCAVFLIGLVQSRWFSSAGVNRPFVKG